MLKSISCKQTLLIQDAWADFSNYFSIFLNYLCTSNLLLLFWSYPQPSCPAFLDWKPECNSCSCLWAWASQDFRDRVLWMGNRWWYTQENQAWCWNVDAPTSLRIPLKEKKRIETGQKAKSNDFISLQIFQLNTRKGKFNPDSFHVYNCIHP